VSDLTKASTSRTVETPSGTLHYQEAGEGYPLILMHGSGAGATGWVNFSNNIGPLAEKFHVYAVDAPGWGDSYPTTYEQFDHLAAHIEFMDALGIEKAALVGNSMGGITAIHLTAKHPDRVSHLITMGSGSTRAPKLFSPGDGPTEGLKVLQLCYREPTFENMSLLCQIMMFDPGDRVDALAQERLDSAVSHPEHLANFLDGLSKGGPIRKWFAAEDLLGITTPTLLFHGRDDRVVPYEHSLLLLAHIPNSRLVLFNRCGHWAMIEHPAEFNRMVADFIENN
jgi:2-hydroxy-6-oxonona-2,4-dienedioate hydrolase